jgi:miniconductance mechanosensitive channel
VAAEIQAWLRGFGIEQELVYIISKGILILAVATVAVLVNLVARGILLRLIHRIVRQTKNRWDDALLDRGVVGRIAHLFPAIVVYASAALVFPAEQDIAEAIRRIAAAYMIAAGVLVLDAVIEAGHDIYRGYEQARRRPIKGYVQLGKLAIFLVGIILIVTTLLNQSPLGILSGLGAMSAVLLLVFRDSILGFVSGIQLSANNLVHIGDWIEMPKYGADGSVVDITLQTIKVQNWDMTITSIPIYALTSDSFKNWRGMSESGGRRIKRSISIDMRSVRFCTEEMTSRFRRYHQLSDYIERKEREILEYNRVHGIEEGDMVSGRRMTNLGTFRAYIAEYLKGHPAIHKDMTFLIRQLPSGPTGVPIEIYVFSSDQAWANYEAIQADIFDHLLAVAPEFGLRVFQEPSGWDLGQIAGALADPDAKA